MSKIKFFSVAMLAFGSATFAQDLEIAKKAIDAEQYEKAKTILKGILKTSPDNGKASFLLGSVYLKQSYQDSAKTVFQAAVTKKDGGNYNYIGLGQLDLDGGNVQAAELNFNQATLNIKKKDIEPLVFLGKAYTNSENPNIIKALEILNKAKLVNPNDAQLQLALGDAYCKQLLMGTSTTAQNDAYAAYRNALSIDSNLLRAKLQQAVLLRGAKAFDGAKGNLEQLIQENPTYASAHRELAETYLQMALASDKQKFKDLAAKAMDSYHKFMSLTDSSVATKMRYAEFLVYTKDFVTLEKEAKALSAVPNINTKIFRYLGIAAYENGNVDAAIDALSKYTANSSNRFIGLDYKYLGLAQLKKAIPTTAEGVKPVVDEALYTTALDNLSKAIGLDKNISNELGEQGKILFDRKLYKYAGGLYEIAVLNTESKNYLYDNFFIGYSYYFNNVGAGVVVDGVQLKKADKAFEAVVVKSPTTQDAHIYRARVNGLLKDVSSQGQMASSYEEFTKVVLAKGGETVEKNKSKLVESYNILARFYAKNDKVKAKEFVNKSLAIDPADKDALQLKTVIN